MTVFTSVLTVWGKKLSVTCCFHCFPFVGLGIGVLGRGVIVALQGEVFNPVEKIALKTFTQLILHPLGARGTDNLFVLAIREAAKSL